MHISPSHFQRYSFFFFTNVIFFFNFNFFSLYTIIIIIFLELRAEEKIICLLYFLSFHFSSQQIKKFLSLYFFISKQVFWQKNKYLFFFSTFSPLSRFICSHAFLFFYFEKLYTHMFTSPTFSSLSHLILPLYYTLILKSTQSDKRVYGD